MKVSAMQVVVPATGAVNTRIDGKPSYARALDGITTTMVVIEPHVAVNIESARRLGLVSKQREEAA
jgi:hypothetical protein